MTLTGHLVHNSLYFMCQISRTVLGLIYLALRGITFYYPALNIYALKYSFFLNPIDLMLQMLISSSYEKTIMTERLQLLIKYDTE